jgi:competence protein ComEA
MQRFTEEAGDAHLEECNLRRHEMVHPLNSGREWSWLSRKIGRHMAFPITVICVLFLSGNPTHAASENARSMKAVDWTGEIIDLESVEERNPKSDKRININAASEDLLCTLPGIGPKRARQIIAKREEKRFTRITQLIQIRGIGWKTLRRLRPLIFIGPPIEKKEPEGRSKKELEGRLKKEDRSICAVPLKVGAQSGAPVTGKERPKDSQPKASAPN